MSKILTCPPKFSHQTWMRSLEWFTTYLVTRLAHWLRILWSIRNSQLASTNLVLISQKILSTSQASQTWTLKIPNFSLSSKIRIIQIMRVLSDLLKQSAYVIQLSPISRKQRKAKSIQFTMPHHQMSLLLRMELDTWALPSKVVMTMVTWYVKRSTESVDINFWTSLNLIQLASVCL